MNVLMVPEAAEMEKALLVGLLSDPSLIPRISTEVDESDFFRHPHKEIFRVIKTLDTNLVDSLTVQEKLTEETKDYFIELVKSSDSLLPSLTNIKVYAETIKEKAKLREGINLGREISALCYEQNIPANEALQKLEGMFSQFLQGRVAENKGLSTKAAFDNFMGDLPYIKAETGLKTGFYGIDQMITSLEGMVVLAARPSLGKTSLATQIMRNVADSRPVVFFSLEQPTKQIFQRMIASESQVNLSDIKSGRYQDDPVSLERVNQASETLKPVMNNIHIDDMGAVNASYVTSVSRQKKFEWGDLGLIIVDYLHIMKLAEGNKVDTLGDAVKELRALGKELNAPILLLSQLSRQNETFVGEGGKRNRRPELTDLRSSGEIEQSADVVMFLWKEKEFDTFTTPAEDYVEVLVRKNRNGPIGMNNLKWIPRFVRFEDI